MRFAALQLNWFIWLASRPTCNRGANNITSWPTPRSSSQHGQASRNLASISFIFCTSCLDSLIPVLSISSCLIVIAFATSISHFDSLHTSSEMSTQIPAKRLLPAAPPLNAHDGPSDNNVTLPGGSEKSYRDSASPHQRQKRIACRDCRQAKVRI